MPSWAQVRKHLGHTWIILAIAIVGIAIWKMLLFHSRLQALENSRWEERLALQHVYYKPIVLFGDSEIENWPVASSFGVLPVLNRGLGGGWAKNALPRFQQDVLSAQPSVVVILIGTNDLAHDRAVDSIVRDISGLIGAARQVGARVLLCSVLPTYGLPATVRPREKLNAMNASLRKLADSSTVLYVDLTAATIDSRGQLDRALSDDGLHLNQSGYLRVTQVLLPTLLNLYLNAKANQAGTPRATSPAPSQG